MRPSHLSGVQRLLRLTILCWKRAASRITSALSIEGCCDLACGRMALKVFSAAAGSPSPACAMASRRCILMESGSPFCAAGSFASAARAESLLPGQERPRSGRGSRLRSAVRVAEWCCRRFSRPHDRPLFSPVRQRQVDTGGRRLLAKQRFRLLLFSTVAQAVGGF